MVIQNLLYRQPQNALQDSGDLDGQILSDLEQLRKDLTAYQSEHLDGKVKGRSNHYEQWSGENAKKLAWISRLIELAAAGLAHDGKNQPLPLPRRFDQAAWYAMNPKFREPAVTAIAMREIERIGRYEMDTVYVEKQSFHPDDWYLWSVAACREREDGSEPPRWSCWTLNLTTGSLNGGHYDMSCQDLKSVLAAKKSVALCDPKDCGYYRADEQKEV